MGFIQGSIDIDAWVQYTRFHEGCGSDEASLWRLMSGAVSPPEARIENRGATPTSASVMGVLPPLRMSN